MTYRCKYFTLRELVPSELLGRYPEDILWSRLDPYALHSLDALREKFGVCYCNTKDMQQRGLRTVAQNGRHFSQHFFGKAFDLSFKDCSAEEVRQYVLKNREEFPYITEIESDVSWFHFAANTNVDGILVFKP